MNQKSLIDEMDREELSNFSEDLANEVGDKTIEPRHSQFSMAHILLFTVGFAGGMGIFQTIPWLQGIRLSMASDRKFDGFELFACALSAIVIGLALSAAYGSGWRSNVGKRLTISVGVSLIAFWLAEITSTLIFLFTNQFHLGYITLYDLPYQVGFLTAAVMLIGNSFGRELDWSSRLACLSTASLPLLVSCFFLPLPRNIYLRLASFLMVAIILGVVGQGLAIIVNWRRAPWNLWALIPWLLATIFLGVFIVGRYFWY